MIKVIAMSALLASALPSSAMAAMLVLPETYENSAIVKVAGFADRGGTAAHLGIVIPRATIIATVGGALASGTVTKS